MDELNPENRISDFIDYEEIEEITPSQLDYVRACVFVESYLSEGDTVTLTVDEDGKLYAYLTDDTDMSEAEVDTWVEAVELYQSEVGGL